VLPRRHPGGVDRPGGHGAGPGDLTDGSPACGPPAAGSDCPMPDDADPMSDLLPEPVAASLPGLVPGPPGAAGWSGPAPLVAVTGVTGYVGGRLVPELLAAGYRVRAVARHPDRLRGRSWYADVETATADAADPAQIRAALDGVDVAYYLI